MYDHVENILSYLKQYNQNDVCDFQWHDKILKKFVDRKEKIRAIIPAFPGKPINPNLAPSNLPDGAEDYALNILKKIVNGVRKIYKPGIEISLFHDGYYFIPLAMDYDYYRMQEYVDIIRKKCKNSDIISIDMNDTTEGSTFEARLNYWNYKNFPTEQEMLEYLNNQPYIIRDLSAFFFYNYSQYLYPTESTHFRQKISKYIASRYIKINLSVQKYIEKKYANYLRFSVKKQCNENSKKMYIDILDGIKNDGLPWMNTLIYENGIPIITKFRKE